MAHCVEPYHIAATDTYMKPSDLGKSTTISPFDYSVTKLTVILQIQKERIK